MFGDEIRDGLVQHFLLVFIEVDSEFLKGFDGGLVRRIILRHPFHFPIQNVEKMRFRMSSAVVAPVTASIGRRAA